MRPPFRADQVGSLLRPERLKQARERFLGPQTPTSALGPHNDPGLRQVEDECIREVVAMQERVGLKAVTDGEFRRRSWWLELILGWEGFEADRTGSAKLKWRNAAGVTQGFSDLNVVGPIRWRPSSVVRAFSFLKQNTKAVPKVSGCAAALAKQSASPISSRNFSPAGKRAAVRGRYSYAARLPVRKPPTSGITPRL